MMGAFRDYGVGFIGGAVNGLAAGILGNGLLGTIAAPILAGSVIKGTSGTVIATVAGFLAAQSLGLFGGGGGASSGSGGGRGEM
ncbi:MAG: hypothetical protein A2Z29_04755 [Chloroflexi bacterium RBG_16_56_11]|nr:MAG: hypothetical protein A2Z29_04755 [Chloroflexi bacterium RBG_16_56_11]